jgi:hypothetical protein
MLGKSLLAAISLLFVVATGSANANTLQIFFDGSEATIRGNVTDGTFNPNLTGFTTLLGWNFTASEGFDIGNASEASEAAFLNTLAGTSFTTGTKTPGTGGDGEFQVNPGYFSLKLGAFTAFFNNVTNAVLTLVYDQTGTAAGWSHLTQFGGTPSQIPLPGALLLMGSALLGAGGFAKWRKRRAQVAAA